MELTKYFEYNIFPQVIEYVKQHPTIDAKTALLIFTTDTVRNAVSYESIVNNMPKEKPLADLYPTFTQQINDVYHQYKGYLEQLEAFEDAITQIPDLSLDYIRGDYSVNAIGSVREMLEVCDNNIFPAIEVVVNKYDVPETQQITDIIKKMRGFYNNGFEGWEIHDIERLLEQLYTQTFSMIYSVLDSIGFGKIGVLYKEIVEHTGKELLQYSTASPVLLVNNAISTIFADLMNPDTERVQTFENKFIEWFSGTIHPKDLLETRNSLLEQPTLFGILAYEAFIRPLGNITHTNSTDKSRLGNIISNLGQLAAIIDKNNQREVVEKLDKIMKNYDAEHREESIRQIINVYNNDIAGKLDKDNVNAIYVIILSFFRDIVAKGRYIPIALKEIDTKDAGYIAVIDKQRVLHTAATHDVQYIQVAPFMANITTNNVKDKCKTYLESFLGDVGLSKSRINTHKSDTAEELKLIYGKKWKNLFQSVENKILERIPDNIKSSGKITDCTAEITLLKAISQIYVEPTTTEDERKILERLLPPHTYMDFVNSAAQQDMVDIVTNAFKQLTAEELYVIRPWKWNSPNDITDVDIEQYTKEQVEYWCTNTKTFAFSNYTATAGMDEQYVTLATTVLETNSMNIALQGRGKFVVYSDPSPEGNYKGLDISVYYRLTTEEEYELIGSINIDSKSSSNADVEKGSKLSNVVQAIDTYMKYKQGDLRNISDKFADVSRWEIDNFLTQTIDKEHTPLLAQISPDVVKGMVRTFLMYYAELPINAIDYLHINTLQSESSQLVKDNLGFYLQQNLTTSAKNISPKTRNKHVIEKYATGELLKELSYVLNKVSPECIIYNSSPSYVFPNGIASSTMPSTAKKHRTLRHTILQKDRSERE